MRTVLVGNIKGGCGKTTLATHIAGAFAAKGLATAIGDCDRQRSSLNWLRRRPESLPPITGLDWSKDVGTPPKGLAMLVIDAPAAMHHKDVESLIGISDIVVVPVLPGAFDEDATAHFLERLAKVKAVRKNKRVVAVVGNRLRPGTRTSDHLDGFFGGLGFPVVARLRDSQIYPSLAAQGSTVLDAKDRRAQSYALEWRPLLELLER
ncbi:chromosome partitioning protein ParA [Paramagnetospirillum kuznetsovii]|uniref:Chromosome partitioning protein ParA n=1 Tax=Paramagnetospirillum kuznetsovii TaxID=2053833 RepID=A0A364P182_9PROT|nr:ParA family protein [Paramagnetospirillum kuznetsovii]RAU22875.1 chromosome partitioning protein ParA [Paramagnetospirillum kuznetsovii]